MQDKLEAVLFDIMLKAGFGPEYVVRYKMVTQFFQQRRTLIILLFGVPCIGSSGSWKHAVHVKIRDCCCPMCPLNLK